MQTRESDPLEQAAPSEKFLEDLRAPQEDELVNHWQAAAHTHTPYLQYQ